MDDYYVKYHALPSSVHMDNSPVNMGHKTQDLLRNRGVSCTTNVPHCSEQNMSERLIQTICNNARAMLCESGRPLWMWGYAVVYAVYVYNRTSTKGNVGGMSPYQMETGLAPSMRDCHQFGAIVYAAVPHDDREHRRLESLAPAAEAGVWVGVAPHSKGHLVFFPNRGRNNKGNALVVRHVVFHKPGAAPPVSLAVSYTHLTLPTNLRV